jgi:hypothetical protein
MFMKAPRTGAPEVTVAEEQEEFMPITVAVYGDNVSMPRTVLTRWGFTPQERQRIMDGEDLYIALATFGNPMQPISVQVGALEPADWTPVEIVGEDEPEPPALLP